MNNYKQIIVLAASLLGIDMVMAGTSNYGHPSVFLGPTARLNFTSPISLNTAYSLAAEAGAKNYRAGVTVGWQFQDYQRIKLSGEYLWQKLTYSFIDANKDQWVRQAAIGADYQFDFGYLFNPQFDLSAYYSHAPSKDLGTTNGTVIVNIPIMGVTNLTTQPFVYKKRIAGSNAGGFSPGLTFQPWDGTTLTFAGNYDYVHYDTRNSPSQDVKGIGGTGSLKQILFDDLSLGLTAAIRKPFNTYEADLGWNNLSFYGKWSLDAFANRTIGKNILPNTWNTGISAYYYFDRLSNQELNYKGNLKGELAVPVETRLLSWVADPAVHMPQVLAVADESFNVNINCKEGRVTLVAPIPSTFFTADSFSVVPFFSGNNVTYTIVAVQLNPFSFDDYVLTPYGEFSYDVGFFGGGRFTIQASNSCNSVTSTFDVGAGP